MYIRFGNLPLFTESDHVLAPGDDPNVMPRRVGEVFSTTVGVVATAFNYPMGKNSVRSLIPTSFLSTGERMNLRLNQVITACILQYYAKQVK